MSKDKSTQGGAFFKTIFSKFIGGGADRVPMGGESTISDADRRIFEEYDGIRQNPDALSGWDFDRAFDFLEKHPDSTFAEKLKAEIYQVSGNRLKGLSHASAIKVLQRMPDHPGAEAIVRGLGKLEEDYIPTLRSDVISYILEILPEHPLKESLTTALAVKNLTNAYNFVAMHPDHPCTPLIIRAMFDRDANIATLLLHEHMDHPRVDAIFEGIYSIKKAAVRKMMPDAILFIIDIAADHPLAEAMERQLVDKNFTKALEYVQHYPDHPHARRISKILLDDHPYLEKLLPKSVV